MSEPHKPPNRLLREARRRLPSPSGSGRPMSRQELADAVNAYLAGKDDQRYQREASLDANHIGKLERGEHRWPNDPRREAFRHVLNATTDRELGFYIIRGLHSESAVTAKESSSDLRSAAPVPSDAADGKESASDVDRRPAEEVETSLPVATNSVPQESDHPVMTRRKDHTTSVAGLGAAAARDSLDFANWVEGSNMSMSFLDYLWSEVGRISINYVNSPPLPLFRDLVGLRDVAFGRLRTGPHKAREVFFLAGTNCILLAHATHNLGGDSTSAMAQVRTALTCAEHADHNGLRAWAYGTAALLAEWTHQYRRAVGFAQRGQRFASTPDSRVRLASFEARAAARAGDRCLALDALDRVVRSRDSAGQHDELDEFGGMLTFPVPKQHYLAGSAYVLLGESEPAEENAVLAIRMYEDGPVEQRSYGDEALARIDVATARLTLGDLDGVQAALRPVLDLPPERRIEQLTVGMGRVRSALTQPKYTRVQIARHVVQEVEQYQAETAAYSLIQIDDHD